MSQYCHCGIAPVGSSSRDGYPLIQSRCHYEIHDVYTIANMVQDYHSQAPSARDVEYVFPLPPSAAVCSFKAIIADSKVIKGVVKEKEEAKKEFTEAVAQGKTAGLLQQEHTDVFRVSLGNIQPHQKISVHISFVSIVPHDGTSPQSLRITMPTAIAPRYGQVPPNIPWYINNNTSNRFELTVAIQMSKPVTAVTSPSHIIGLTLGSAEREVRGEFDPTKAFIHLGEAAFLDRDIVLVIAAQALDVPRCSVERWLASEGAEETTDAYALTLVPKFDLPALPNQEYIFLVDRSGSMAGGRMTAVKTGLQIMLRSLPSEGTTFNIVSFGSHYTSLWPKSQMYTAETVAEASRHVDTFTASYGGTEMRAALRFAFQSRLALTTPSSTEKLPAAVFVLTDGEAWDLNGVVDVVTENAHLAKVQDSLLRTFVLGVGNQVSTAMCEGISRAGKGCAVFVATGEKPDAKLMNLLKAARGAVIEDLTVDWGVSELEKEPEEDFEMVSGPSEAGPVPQSGLPPLNLFDEQTPSTDQTEVGPKRTIVHLPPPPVIQQAPKSDKLPIPLYPGFRCSIFAIIRRSSIPGPPSTTVRITGKVMGRDVSFQTQVTPRGVSSAVASTAMESGKLLHTLAAKALIQVYEDVPSTPLIKAHIERLGKRYSLASSVTSFLAIDEDSRRELHEIYVPTRRSQDNLQAHGSSIAPAGISALSWNDAPALYGTATPHFAAVNSSPPSSPLVGGLPDAQYFGYSASSANMSPVPGSLIGSSMPPTGMIPQSRTRHSRRPRKTFTETYDPTEYDDVDPTLAPNSQEEYSSGPRAAPTAASDYYDPTICEDSPREEYSARRNDSADRPSYQDSSQDKDALRSRSRSFIPAWGTRGGGGEESSRFSKVLSFGKKKKRDSTSALPDVQGSPAVPSGSSSYSRPTTTASSVSSYVPPVGTFTTRSLSSDQDAGSPTLYERVDSSRMPVSGARTTTVVPVTLEMIVRSQKFNGSFPDDQGFLTQLCGNKPVPVMAAVLRDLTGNNGRETAKTEIWATVLTLACLKRKFALEKDSWEIIADKAMLFVKNALEGIGAGNSTLIDTLVADAESLF